MHELSCPSCNAASHYDLRDYLLMCPLCSLTFHMDPLTGKKESYGDHYIVPNAIDPRQVKDLTYRWLKRIHHNPTMVDREFFVVGLTGFSIPFWVVSLEAHTEWKGLSKRHKKSSLDAGLGSGFVMEKGQFRRNYRWAISARNNICENWGMTQLHEPKEQIKVDWDGFPLDSTYSRGRIDPNLGVKKRTTDNRETDLSAYDIREFFEFKYANGMPILPIQTSEEDAIHRTKWQVERYHHELAKLNVDTLLDNHTEVEIAGVQLIHLPFWFARYRYRPTNIMRHIQRSTEKSLIIEGYAGGVLKSELAMIHRDKLWINAIVCFVAAFLFVIVGSVWHSAFFLIGLVSLTISILSAMIATTRNTKNETSSFFYSEDGDGQGSTAQGNSDPVAP